MSITAILIAIGGLIATVFGALKFGQHKGKTEADAKHTAEIAKADADRAVQSGEKAAEAQVSAATNATKVSNEVNSLTPGDAASELRDKYSRD